jgi:dihydrofolate synthase/folylpolyglutamate synthase
VWSKHAAEKAIELRIKLLGEHQIQNAVTAFAALKAFAQQGLVVGDEAIQAGFAAAEWPGRFEVREGNPVIVLDSAHTPDAARALRRTLDEHFPNQGIVMVLGISSDKNLGALMEPVRDRLIAAVATQSSHARALPAKTLAKRLDQIGIDCQSQPDPVKALQAACTLAGSDKLILITGSVFLVDQLREETT